MFSKIETAFNEKLVKTKRDEYVNLSSLNSLTFNS